MTERPSLARWRDEPGLLVAAVVLVVLCWIMGNPRSSGPDEPSHMVASAGLVRGDREGRVNPDPLAPGTHLIEVPGMVGAPDPGCWAFKPDVPVACANAQPLSTDSREMPTSSYNYPPWTLFLPGLASFTSSAGGYAYLARLLNAAIPIALVSAALIALVRRRPILSASALLGLTPIAWFTFGFVSPSAVAIGGGLALWTGLLLDRDRLTQWLVVTGWAAVMLARRDGPVWAVLIVLACCLVTTTRPFDLWRRLDQWARWAVLVIAPLPILVPLINGDRDSNLLITFAPVALVVADLLARRYERLTSPAARRALVGYSVVAVALIAVGLVLNRPGGFRAETLRLVVSNTGEHLRQLVGDLGWLDTAVPAVAVFLFWAIVGGLATVAVLEYGRAAAVYLGALGAAVGTAWLLELGQGANYGEYWQGRYTMPFAVGLPVVLAWRPDAPAWLEDRLVPIVGWSSWAIWNLAFVSAQRRWGVGTTGSWYPWDWDTWGSPITPFALSIAHAAGTAVLVACCTSRDEPGEVAA
jgi:hypothetical protein